jgi:RNA polymerase sigma-70 factor (ECF subfamily)
LPTINHSSDHELIILVAQGDHEAFSVLFRRHHRKVFSVAKAMTKSDLIAEEVVQEVFIKVWSRRTELPKLLSFENFLFIIARNHIYNTLRRKVNEETFLRHLEQHFSTLPKSVEDSLHAKDFSRILQCAVRELPRQQQLVFRLAHHSELDHAGIGQVMGISKYTVKNHMAKAVESIRYYFRRRMPD